MNKHERELAGKKVVRRRALKLGWKEPIPEATRLALLNTGGIRIPLRDNKRRFGKTSGKRYYGHFGGYGSTKHLPKKALQERAEIISHETDQTN